MHRLLRALALNSLLVTLGVIAPLSAGCASRYRVEASAPTYAAIGKITVKVNKTENRILRVRILHLAPAQRINPRFTHYAVWISVPGVGVSKAGLLDFNDRQRRGRLVATTPHRNFEVIVTLESDRSASVPSPDIILRKVVGRT